MDSNEKAAEKKTVVQVYIFTAQGGVYFWGERAEEQDQVNRVLKLCGSRHPKVVDKKTGETVTLHDGDIKWVGRDYELREKEAPVWWDK